MINRTSLFPLRNWGVGSVFSWLRGNHCSSRHLPFLKFGEDFVTRLASQETKLGKLFKSQSRSVVTQIRLGWHSSVPIHRMQLQIKGSVHHQEMVILNDWRIGPDDGRQSRVVVDEPNVSNDCSVSECFAFLLKTYLKKF